MAVRHRYTTNYHRRRQEKYHARSPPTEMGMGHRYTSNHCQRRPENHQASPPPSGMAAFFVGKLNKTHNRDQIYRALRVLGNQYNFYIAKLDMPYGDPKTKKGNRGYCFVYCKTQEEADRIVDLHYIQLGSQKCEVKPYTGLMMKETESDTTSGFATPSSEPETLKDIAQDIEAVLSRGNRDGNLTNRTIQETQGQFENQRNEFIRGDAGVSHGVNAGTVFDSFRPEVVSSYVQAQMIFAQQHGYGNEFCDSYFSAYCGIEAVLRNLDVKALASIAQKYEHVLKPLL